MTQAPDEREAIVLAKCQVCGALAVWQYQPSDGFGEYCDDHVPRGCSCNIIDMGNPRARKQHRDDQGRLLPCCELWFDEQGWEPTDRAEVEVYRAKSKAFWKARNLPSEQGEGYE